MSYPCIPVDTIFKPWYFQQNLFIVLAELFIVANYFSVKRIIWYQCRGQTAERTYHNCESLNPTKECLQINWNSLFSLDFCLIYIRCCTKNKLACKNYKLRHSKQEKNSIKFYNISFRKIAHKIGFTIKIPIFNHDNTIPF